MEELGLLAILAGLGSAARANTADSLTVTIQPQAAYSVLVTTTPADKTNAQQTIQVTAQAVKDP